HGALWARSSSTWTTTPRRAAMRTASLRRTGGRARISRTARATLHSNSPASNRHIAGPTGPALTLKENIMSTMPAEANINTDTVHSETQVQVRHLAALLLFAAKNDTRNYLNGIHMYASRDGNLILEATDGHRLMRIVTDAPHRAPVGAIMGRDM